MNPIFYRSLLLPCLLILLSVITSSPASGTNHGNTQVAVRVWEFDSATPLPEIGPIARQLSANSAKFYWLPNPQPMLPGMLTAPVILPTAEAMNLLRVLETDFGAKSHPMASRTVQIGQEVAFTIPFATEKLEMRVLTVMKCRRRDEVNLLASFPDDSRTPHPILEIGSLAYSYEERSCLLCRTEAKGSLLHHTLILLEESHYGVRGTNSVTRIRNQMQRLILPQAHLENLNSLRLLEWLVQQSRSSNHTSRRGISAIWRLETEEDVKNSYPLGIESLFNEEGTTLRKALTVLTELSQMDMGIEQHALVFHTSSTDDECSPGELYTRQFQVQPQILKRYVDSPAINQAASSSNIPTYYYADGGFSLDREHFILNYRQAPEHFMLAEKWLRDQNLLNGKPPPPPPLSAALAKAGKIILPQLDLRRASLNEAVQAIQQAASAADPPVKNLKIVIEPGNKEKTFITMFTRGMPADEALKHCARLSFHRIEADETTILLKPSF